MKLIRLDSIDPTLNLAIEEYLFKYTNDDYFILWRNRPTVVIGKNQNAYVEVNLDFAKENDITVVRRITGGGAVFHDLGNVNYSFIASGACGVDFSYCTRPIVDFFKAQGVDCVLNGRNDLLIGDKKISGNAQYTVGNRRLHHGTMLFDADFERMASVLNYNRDKYEYRAVKSHSSRVGNIKELIGASMSVDGFLDLLVDYLRESISDDEYKVEINDKILELQKKYMDPEWTYSSKRFLTDYSKNVSKKFSFGLVRLGITINKNVIESIAIGGDYFELQPIELLERSLIGANIDALDCVDVDKFIDGMSDGDFLELIKK